MKFIFALVLLLAAPLRAELLATFQTTRGNVIVKLQYDKTPQAVANFITLAQGTRPWVNPFTGAVRKARFYDGIKIHRTSNDSVYKFAQGGSPNGLGTDGPGYTIRDEFHLSLTHVPYVLSMANAGPNTNGSQFFFTGSLSQPMYDGSYTIFGLVTDSASRAVVDAMIAAGPNGTTINSVSIQRTDAAAIAFNEHAQKLPVCSGVAGNLEVVPGVSVAYQLAAPQPAGSEFQVFRSLDMQSWVKRKEIYQGTGVAGVGQHILDNETFSKGFYNLPLVTYPDALAPAQGKLANRTLFLTLNGTQTLTFQFNTGGMGGTLVYSEDPTPTVFTLESYTPEPHNAEWIMNTVYGYLGFVCSLDSENSTQILGRNTTYQYGVTGWVEIGSGTLSLSK